MWKYYKDFENTVYAFNNDGSQDAYIKLDLTPITENDANELRTAQSEQAGTTVPSFVQNRQAKLALLSAGLFKRVEEIINSMEGDEGDAARIEWGATTFSRNSAFLKKMAMALGLSEKQLDDLFILAATYE